MKFEELKREVEEQARAVGMTPGEYMTACQQLMKNFTENAPQILNELFLHSGEAHKENDCLKRRMAMGCRRVHGSF